MKIQLFAIAFFLAFASQPLQCLWAQTDEDKVNFVLQVKPLLEKYCLHCHGPDLDEAGIRVDRKSDLIGSHIKPGESAADSDFFELLVTDDENFKMPPPGEEELNAEEIAVFRKWIDQGAEWPDDVDFDTPTEPADADPSRTGENQEAAGDDVVKDQPASADDTKAKTPRRSKKTDPKENFPLALWENIGVTHPILVHFPVALLIGGALFAIFGFRGDSPLGDAAYYCLWLAAWTGILASIVGWSYAEYYHRHGATWDELDFSKTIVLHRWLGILLSILTFVLALIARSSRLNDPYATGALWKLGMVVLAALCGFVGHLGGDLTHKGEVKRAMRNLGLIQEENQRQQPAEPKTTEEENDGDATNKESDSEHGEHQGENQGDNEDNEARANLRKNGLSDGLHNSAYVPTI